MTTNQPRTEGTPRNDNYNEVRRQNLERAGSRMLDIQEDSSYQQGFPSSKDSDILWLQRTRTCKKQLHEDDGCVKSYKGEFKNFMKKIDRY